LARVDVEVGADDVSAANDRPNVGCAWPVRDPVGEAVGHVVARHHDVDHRAQRPARRHYRGRRTTERRHGELGDLIAVKLQQRCTVGREHLDRRHRDRSVEHALQDEVVFEVCLAVVCDEPDRRVDGRHRERRRRHLRLWLRRDRRRGRRGLGSRTRHQRQHAWRNARYCMHRDSTRPNCRRRCIWAKPPLSTDLK
jgi:hypothetical protein